MLSVDVPSDTFEEAEQIVPEEEAEVFSGETDKNSQETGKEYIPVRAIPSHMNKDSLIILFGWVGGVVKFNRIYIAVTALQHTLRITDTRTVQSVKILTGKFVIIFSSVL